MTLDTIPKTEQEISLEERGKAARKAAMAKFGGLFKRFGRGVDVSIGAVMAGAEATGRVVDTGIGAIDSGIETVKERTVEAKEFVFDKVKQTAEGAKNLMDSGVALTQETYVGVKNKIMDAKRSVFSFIEAKKAAWEQKRKEAQRRIVENKLAQLVEQRTAHLEAAKALTPQIAALRKLLGVKKPSLATA